MRHRIWSVYQVWCTPPHGAPVLVRQVYTAREAEALLAAARDTLGDGADAVSIRRVRGLNPWAVFSGALLVFLLIMRIPSPLIRVGGGVFIVCPVLFWSMHRLTTHPRDPNANPSAP